LAKTKAGRHWCRQYGPASQSGRLYARGEESAPIVIDPGDPDVPTSDVWDEATAARYDDEESAMFTAAVVTPAVQLLSELAGSGCALEFAIGTGRLAIPLVRSGIPTAGIDLSPAMIKQLRGKIAERELPAVVGDMTRTRIPGEFNLVFVAFNSISNLRTQAEQVACFRNAARHLAVGGHFVIELFVPPLRRLVPGQTTVPFVFSEDHAGFDSLDVVTQAGTSHHYIRRHGDQFSHRTNNFRYIWPAECDLMAELAGLEPVARYGDWNRSPFTADSAQHISIWRKPH
jgi:SAM-dependent methyltransferase